MAGLLLALLLPAPGPSIPGPAEQLPAPGPSISRPTDPPPRQQLPEPPPPPELRPPPVLPEPAGLPRTVFRERGRSPAYYRGGGGRQPIRVGGRLGFGVAGRLAGPLPVRAGFALDVLAVARVPVSRGGVAFGLFPEFGYSLLASTRHTRGNFFTGGIGLGVLRGPLGVAVIPRAVVGALNRERAVGVRTGLLAEMSKDGGFSLEVAHQALFTPKGVVHELRITLAHLRDVPMTRAALLLAVLVAAVVAACAPSQQRLLAARHYAEALRGVEAGGVDGAAVLAAIERDLQVGLHMQAVGAADLRAQLPAAPPALDDLVLVRVSHDANLTPITWHELSLSLLHRQSLLPPIAADRPTLAAIFGETLPQAVVTVTPGTHRYKSIGLLELLGRVVVNVVTVGLVHSEIPILPSEQVGGSVDTTQPTDVDYRRASPISEQLYHWLQSPPCSPGLLCRYHVLWPRPQVGGEAPLELAVSLTIDRDIAILYRFALPAGSLEGALTTMFGDRMRTLDELQRRYGRSRVAVHPLDVLEPREQGGFTPESRARLERLVLGTRRRPGLRTRPGLRFLVDPAAIYGVAQAPQVAELRIILLGLGLTDSQIEIRPDEPQGLGARLLRVQYDLPPRIP